MHRLKESLVGAVLALVLAAAMPLAFAQDASRGSGKIIVGNAPGGGTDVVARIVASYLSSLLGINYVVENRPGASGNIAAEAVAKAAPDGNTLLAVFNSHSTIGPLFPNLPFDPVRDLASVGQISDTPYLLVARNNIGADNLRELVEQAKRSKRPVTAGTAGRGTPQHLLFEILGKTSGITVSAIHYKGTAPAQNDLLGGHLDVSLMTPSLGAQMVKAGKSKLLAVTSEARLVDFPNVPTVREQGFDSLAGSGVWIALLVPGKTPRPTVMRLNKALNDALKFPETIDKLKAVGMTPTGGPPEYLDKIIQTEQAAWTALIRELSITVE